MRRVTILVAATPILAQMLLTNLTKAGEDVRVERRIKDVVSPASKDERARNIVVRIRIMVIDV
jgi:hypothetical protein